MTTSYATVCFVVYGLKLEYLVTPTLLLIFSSAG